MTDFTTAYAALSFSFAGREGGEVVVEQEAVATLVEHVVENLLVEFGTEGNGGQGLRLTTGEHGRSVRTRQVVYFAPDGANLRGGTAVETDAFVEDAATYGLFLYIVVVAAYERFLFGELFFAQTGQIVVDDSVEGVLAGVLVGITRAGNGVSLVVAFCPHVFAQIFVVGFVAIFAFYGRTHGLGQLFLYEAVNLDGFMGGFEGFEQVGLRNFVHFAFDHHDVFISGTYHQIHVGSFEFAEGRIYSEFTVDAGNPYFRNRTVEGNIRHGQGSRCGQTGQGIGHVYAIGREQHDVHEGVGVIVVGEQRTQYAVYQAGGEYLVV